MTAEVCGALDHSCCEPCSDHTKAYLDCFLDFEVSGTCPEASCTAGGADNGREISNSTSPTGSLSATKPNATNAEDATTGAGGKPSGTPQVSDNASAGNATTATTDNANITKECDTVARDLKTCVDLNCAFRNCNDNPLGCKYNADLLNILGVLYLYEMKRIYSLTVFSPIVYSWSWEH